MNGKGCRRKLSEVRFCTAISWKVWRKPWITSLHSRCQCRDL